MAALPSGVDSNTVVLVSDTTTCRLAWNAYNRVTTSVHSTDTAQQVDVIHFGNRYVVTDRVKRAGEWEAHTTYDSTFTTALAGVLR